MKICFPICHPGLGGSEKYALYLAQKAKENGHDVLFVLGEEGPLAKVLTKNNFEYRLVGMRSSLNPLLVILSIVKLSELFKKNEIEIVHASMLREQSLAIGAKIAGANIKIIRTFHRLDQFNWKMKPLMWVYRRYTELFIAPTRYIKKYLEEHGIRRNIIQIKNGVPSSKISTHKRGIGFLGRLCKEKGILEFVKQNGELFIENRLVIAGDGPERQRLKEVIGGYNIELMGQIENLDSFFEQISVLILPSETEVLPLSVLEAFSAGIPVVSFVLPSLEGVIMPNNGRMISPGDYRLMATTAIEILENPKELKRLSLGVRESYKTNYTIDKMWKETESVYKSLLA